MTPPKQDRSGPDAWGVHRSWVNARDESQTVPERTVLRFREIIGTPPADLEQTAPIVTRRGRSIGLGRVEVACEDGQARTVHDVLPDDFPLGYHSVRTEGQVRRLIVSPGRCWLPEGWRAWGWTAQLYAARSAQSWGVGDLRDLRALREWSESLGAGFLLVNPLHAVGPTFPQEDSPYLPATRQFRNPIYLRVEDVPGADRVDLSAFEERRRGANESYLIERDDVWRLKEEALRQIFDPVAESPGFDRWRKEQGPALADFATWCALAQEHGPDWREWPDPFRDPAGQDVARFAEEHAAEVSFHAWLQWLLEEQLRSASGDLTIVQDLPIGVAGGGSDAWAWQDLLAAGVSVGAPPDIFNPRGQDWGSPPMIPWRMRESGYEGFIASIRRTIAGAGGLRIDHVMGLFRLWWVPADGGSAEGAYVRYPSADLLDIVALESHRARAIVVGEDLGTVEPGVREALAEHGILSYRLLWFEEDSPDAWPITSMAAVTTHDLPTVAGLWTGADAEEQRRYSDLTEEQVWGGRDALLSRLRQDYGLRGRATADEAVSAAHRLLARSPSILISATLEDAIGEERRPNIPGALARPNWRIPLAVPVQELPGHPGAQELASTLLSAVEGPRQQ